MFVIHNRMFPQIINSLRMKIHYLVFAMILCFNNDAKAQYYFKDIVSSTEATKTFNAYKQNKISKVVVNMQDNYGDNGNDFRLEKKIDKKYGRTEMLTKTQQSPTSLMITTHDAQGKTLYTLDSSSISVVKTYFKYNDQQQITSIDTKIFSADDDFITEIDELHDFEYDDKGVLQKMYRIQNKRDTTVILFANDSQGNISVEKNTSTGTKFYYYYDENNRLTDIVQASLGRDGLHPDYIFAYNRLGELTQMITTGESNNEYVTWKYTYENGLRTSEKLFGKDRKLIGTMEYVYK